MSEKKVSKSISFDKKKLATISVCMIVRNNEKELERLLPSIYKSVDEIIIVDTGSTDGTINIAKKYANIFVDYTQSPDYNLLQYTYKDEVYNVISDFAKARNESLKYATKDYILWLDADDFIGKQDIARLRFHLMAKPNTATLLLVADKRIDRDFQLLQLRVFPNHQGIEFSGRIHEQVSSSVVEKGIKYSHSEVTINHLGYRDDDEILKKLARNEMLLEIEVKENPDNFMANLNFAKSLTGSGRFEEAEGYVDKAIYLVRNGLKMDTESVFLALLTKATLLGQKGKTKEALEVLENDRSLLCKNDIYLLTTGDLYYKTGNYEKAYEDLKVLTKGTIGISSIPMDIKNLVQSLVEPLLVSSLYMGDLKTSEFCIKLIFNIPKFRIGKIIEYGEIYGNNQTS